jgi:glycosyltransferase involved in cell wall biosynthesis
VKIVLPIHHFPPRYSAGAELYTFRLARWLRMQGHHAEVVCVEQVDDSSAAPLNAVHDSYEGVPVWRLSFDMGAAPDRMLWSYANPAIGDWFNSYLVREQPDVVHLQSGYLIGIGALEAARQRTIPTVVTLHDFWFLCPRITLLRGDGSLCLEVPADPAACAWCMLLEGRRFRLPEQLSGGMAGRAAVSLALQPQRVAVANRRRRLAAALAAVDAAIAPSHFLAAKFIEHIAPERLHILRYGLDSERLQQAPAPPEDGTLRLGYIGQIGAHKGVHVIVEAIKSLPERGRPVAVTIYGDLNQHAHYSRRLRAQIDSDPRITLAGRFDNSRIAEVLGGFDATIVPSIWYENSPLAIMEAHAAGRPVLTSALGGMAELVRDEIDGLHFRAGDAADLARQIQRLRENPELLSRLRSGVRTPSSIDAEMQRLMQIYQAVRSSAQSAMPNMQMTAAGYEELGV